LTKKFNALDQGSLSFFARGPHKLMRSSSRSGHLI